MVAFLDDSLKSFGFLGKAGCLLLLDADGIVGKQLFLGGLELTLIAKLRETGCDLLCGHLLLLRAIAHEKLCSDDSTSTVIRIAGSRCQKVSSTKRARSSSLRSARGLNALHN